jgi:Protein of unknown function (DUF2612)
MSVRLNFTTLQEQGRLNFNEYAGMHALWKAPNVSADFHTLVYWPFSSYFQQEKSNLAFNLATFQFFNCRPKFKNNVFSNAFDVRNTTYTDLIPYPHNTKPKFMEMIYQISSAFQNLYYRNTYSIPLKIQELYKLYDLDSITYNSALFHLCEGIQLDSVGAWIGVNRILEVHNGDTYQQISLSDSDYRSLLKTKIINNHWLGPIHEITDNLNSHLPEILGTDKFFYTVQDSKGWMSIGIVSKTTDFNHLYEIPNDETVAFLLSDKIDYKPMGIEMKYKFYPKMRLCTNPSIFGFDQNGDGFDQSFFDSDNNKIGQMFGFDTISTDTWYSGFDHGYFPIEVH